MHDNNIEETYFQPYIHIIGPHYNPLQPTYLLTRLLTHSLTYLLNAHYEMALCLSNHSTLPATSLEDRSGHFKQISASNSNFPGR